MTLLELLGSGDFVKEAGATARSIIDGLFGWIPNRKNEEETKRKEQEVKLALAELVNKLSNRELDLKQAAMEMEAKISEVTFQLRQAIATSWAGQFVIYGFGGITILQLAFNGLVVPFTSMAVLPIASEQWWLLFGVMGLEKLIDLKTRGTKQEGTK